MGVSVEDGGGMGVWVDEEAGRDVGVRVDGNEDKDGVSDGDSKSAVKVTAGIVLWQAEMNSERISKPRMPACFIKFLRMRGDFYWPVKTGTI